MQGMKREMGAALAVRTLYMYLTYQGGASPFHHGTGIAESTVGTLSLFMSGAFLARLAGKKAQLLYNINSRA